MHSKDLSAQPGSSSSRGPYMIQYPISRGYPQPEKTRSSVMPHEDPSEQPAHVEQDLVTVDTIYKIVYSDRHHYPQNGRLYIRYNVPPEKDSTGWFCIAAFYWEDVHAEFECVYHPSINLFDDFKPVKGSLRGGSRGIQSVQILMWNFADRGPDLNFKHTVRDDNGNRIMLAILILKDASAVRLHGKMLIAGEDEREVCLSREEHARLGLRR